MSLLPRNDNNDIEIFIVRHGRSLGQDNIDAYKNLGDRNIPLTETGILQSVAAGEFLADYTNTNGIPLSIIFNSTCKRADHTAENMHDALTNFGFVTRHPDERINKQKFGRLDGLFTDEERRTRQPEAFANFAAQLAAKGPYHARPAGGESIRDVFDRTADFLSETLERPKSFIVVTHGLVALCIEQALLGRSEEWVLQNTDKIANCEVRKIYGSADKGFKAETICDNPLQWQQNRGNVSTPQRQLA